MKEKNVSRKVEKSRIGKEGNTKKKNKGMITTTKKILRKIMK